MRVLLIEDDETGRETLSKLIVTRGHQVEAYASAEEGLKRVLSDGIKFDRIVSDMRLPGMNGLEFLERLRRNPFSRNVNFVLISAYQISTDPHETDLFTACLAEDAKFVEKPFDADRFISLYIDLWTLNSREV